MVNNSIERSGFFASINNDKLYTDDEFAQYFQNFLKNGIMPTPNGDGLLVQADGSNRLIVNTGDAWIEGRTYKLIEQKTLDVAPGHELLDRIDRVVVRCDYINRSIYVTIKQGEPSSSPAIPPLQRDSDAYELSLCYYRVDKGVTNIQQSYLVDTRYNVDTCGEVTSIIDKHSLKEFLKDAGFVMKGDMHTKNIIPNEAGKTIGTKEKPYGHIYADRINTTYAMPYLSENGGTVKGEVKTQNLVPATNNVYNLGDENNRYNNLYVNNLDVRGQHPFISKTGGTLHGPLIATGTPANMGYHMKFESYDGNTQGDGSSYIGYNLNGYTTHMFRGNGDFSIGNPITLAKDVRCSGLVINGKRVYIQSEAPANPTEGAVWIQV